MADITERFQPSFVRWPIQNARTGFRPVNIPLILVVPFTRLAGIPVADSAISDLTYLIEDAPSSAKVAGFQNRGILIPRLERFVVNVSTQQLLNVKIPLEGLVFIDQITGEQKDFEDAIDGDRFEYTLMRGYLDGPGARDTIQYYSDADYFDLSIFIIDPAELKPYGRYNFVWKGSYFTRAVTDDLELLCVDTTTRATARFELEHAHPGEVHLAMIENTPSLYFTGKPFEDDDYIRFIRPFADILQDVYDEQTFIEGINYVNKIPPQLIPYLAYLVGWELPYFPGTNDKIRRNILRNARRLQQLKGSKRVLTELFEMFGFAIEIDNLYYSPDGSKLLAAGEAPISLEEVCQTDPLISNYSTDGFGQLDISLLFTATSNITIDAWLVEETSDVASDLVAIAESSSINPNNPEGTCSFDSDGFIISPVLSGIDGTIIGFSQVLVALDSGIGIDDRKVNDAPLSKIGLKYNKDTNVLSVIFDHYIAFTNGNTTYKLFVFASYARDKITLPGTFTDLISNRFDIQILSKRGEQPTSQLYEFLLDFILKLKAFHSLLRKIVIVSGVSDVYLVQDFCLGGTNKQAPGTDAGELQIPPATIPNDTTACDSDRGFSQILLDLRSELIAGLEAEHKAWKDLDSTHDVPDNLRPILQSLSRIAIPRPDPLPCEFTQFGQDRVIADNSVDFDQEQDNRDKLCALEGNTSDYCYKGRVQQTLDNDGAIVLSETVRCRPCSLMMGIGAYYTSPIVAGNGRTNISNYNKSFLHTLFTRVMAYQNATLHYTNRAGFRNDLLDSNEFFAVRRPSLEIEKDNMFFPGHRFITMDKLENDFTSTHYSFRPWDDIFHVCPEDRIAGAPTLEDLNPTITIDSSGNEVLSFEYIPLTYYGNGLVPDISSMGYHEDRDFTVTHAIYSSAEERDGITFSGIVFTDATAICLDNTLGPIFKSANRNCTTCPTDAINATTDAVAVDYVDGYPALTGRYTVNIDDYDYPRGNTDDVDLTAIGLPGSDTGTSLDLLFKLGSGIFVPETDPKRRFYEPYRLDCGCSYYDCEGTSPSEAGATIDRCHIDLFREADGELDVHCDKLTLSPTMILNEKVGTCSYTLDGTIPNMLMFDTDLSTPLSEKLPREGSFRFVDSYGIIYESMFESAGGRIDITVTTKDPRVWGEAPSGFIRDGRVFRKGTITTCRHILEGSEDGYIILAEGCEQHIDFFQTNLVCGDVPFVDPFAFHLDCGVVDTLEMEVTEVTG